MRTLLLGGIAVTDRNQGLMLVGVALCVCLALMVQG